MQSKDEFLKYCGDIKAKIESCDDVKERILLKLEMKLGSREAAVLLYSITYPSSDRSLEVMINEGNGVLAEAIIDDDWSYG